MEIDLAAGNPLTGAGASQVTKFGRVGVLMGGPSSEREISLKSGRAVLEALRGLGLDVVDIDINGRDPEENIALIKSKNISCAFIALHGYFGEDGQIQELLERMKIPYTGSDIFSSRLAMDKTLSQTVFASNGLNVPKYKVVDKVYNTSIDNTIFDELGLPMVIKPASNGSSIGLSIIEKKDDLIRAIDLAFSYGEMVIIEEYIKGRELTVGILDNRPLPVIEIIPKKSFFDYEAKYKAGLSEYIVPADLALDVAKNVQEQAILAHRLLGCYGCSRVDIILDKNNIPFILEVNTIPGMTGTSLLPKAAKTAGMDFAQLCLRLIELAYEKK